MLITEFQSTDPLSDKMYLKIHHFKNVTLIIYSNH